VPDRNRRPARVPKRPPPRKFRVEEEHPADRGRPEGAPMADAKSYDQLVQWVTTSRRKQGLPETIEDPGLLAALAQLVEEVTEQCWELPPKSA
jgi:hypothetical protein